MWLWLLLVLWNVSLEFTGRRWQNQVFRHPLTRNYWIFASLLLATSVDFPLVHRDLSYQLLYHFLWGKSVREKKGGIKEGFFLTHWTLTNKGWGSITLAVLTLFQVEFSWWRICNLMTTTGSSCTNRRATRRAGTEWHYWVGSLVGWFYFGWGTNERIAKFGS